MGKTDKRLMINLDPETAAKVEKLQEHLGSKLKIGRLTAVFVVRNAVQALAEREKIKE